MHMQYSLIADPVVRMCVALYFNVMYCTYCIMQQISSDALNTNDIMDLERGLSFTKRLELPKTLTFNEELMADFFLGEEKARIIIRPFGLLK